MSLGTLDKFDRTLSADNYIEFYRDRALFDDTHVVIREEDFMRMSEYSTTLPTGKSVGKVWRRHCWKNLGGGQIEEWWMMGSYEDIPDDPSHLLIRWREVLSV